MPNHSLSRIVREIAQELYARPPLPISAQSQPQSQQPAQQQQLPASNMYVSIPMYISMLKLAQISFVEITVLPNPSFGLRSMKKLKQ
jgi:hypothetical protein